jgi:hypothetical protein
MCPFRISTFFTWQISRTNFHIRIRVVTSLVKSGSMRFLDGKISGFVSELIELQRDLLTIRDLPKRCNSYGHLFNSSQHLKAGVESIKTSEN